MPDPTPLTDEQIDVHLRAIRECYDGDAGAVIAAVIARAKREERERIGARTIYVVQQWVEADGIRDGWNTAYGHFTNSRADAEGRLEYLQKTHRDAEFRLVTATRSDWQEANHA